jgi:hypothetical protein
MDEQRGDVRQGGLYGRGVVMKKDLRKKISRMHEIQG